MIISNTKNGNQLIISLDGKLDSISSPELENNIKEMLDGVTELIFDFEKLDYISSAGLRVLLASQKKLSGVGTMKIINVCETVAEIFNITGFDSVLTIE